MQEDLKLGGYSPSTRRIYLLYARMFAKFHMRSPAEMSEPEIRQYLLHLIEQRKIFRHPHTPSNNLHATGLRRSSWLLY